MLVVNCVSALGISQRGMAERPMFFSITNKLNLKIYPLNLHKTLY